MVREEEKRNKRTVVGKIKKKISKRLRSNFLLYCPKPFGYYSSAIFSFIKLAISLQASSMEISAV